MIRLLAILSVLAGGVVALAEDKEKMKNAPTMQPRVKMVTSLGEITLELDADRVSPKVLRLLQEARLARGGEEAKP